LSISFYTGTIVLASSTPPRILKAKWKRDKKTFNSAGNDSGRPMLQAKWPSAVLPSADRLARLIDALLEVSSREELLATRSLRQIAAVATAGPVCVPWGRV
jgi:hypothetical protein